MIGECELRRSASDISHAAARRALPMTATVTVSGVTRRRPR
jgi:hypothetical protein